MATAMLNLHAGGQDITRDDLELIPAPPPTTSWYPTSHSAILDAALSTIESSGFRVTKQSLSVSKYGHRFFGILDLANEICPGITLVVGLRNSTDKSFPIGFCAGNRVFVCSNLAFTSEIVISRKHTKHGQERYREGIASAVNKLGHYQEAQATWISGLRSRHLSRQEADSIILRSYEEEVIGARMLPEVLKEWRNPRYEEFREPTAWSLWNSYTTILGLNESASNPAKAALTTIKLQRLMSPEVIDVEFKAEDSSTLAV